MHNLKNQNTVNINATHDSASAQLRRKFEEASNTTQMVKYFLAIVKTQKGNFANIQECFKTVTQYCKDEPYYEHLKVSIVNQIDVDMLGITQNISDISELF